MQTFPHSILLSSKTMSQSHRWLCDVLLFINNSDRWNLVYYSAFTSGWNFMFSHEIILISEYYCLFCAYLSSTETSLFSFVGSSEFEPTFFWLAAGGKACVHTARAERTTSEISPSHCAPGKNSKAEKCVGSLGVLIISDLHLLRKTLYSIILFVIFKIYVCL